MLPKRFLRVVSTVAIGVLGYRYAKELTKKKEYHSVSKLKGYFPKIAFPTVHADLSKRFLEDFKHINEDTGLSFEDISQVDLIYFTKHQCQRFYFLEYEDFFLCFDAEKKNPAFTYEHLTPESFKDKKRLGFKRKDDKSGRLAEEPRLPQGLRVPPNDDFYPFAKGHLVSKENHKGSLYVCQTNFTTNYFPQDCTLRKYGWKYLEEFTKELTCKYGDIFIISGPMYNYGPKNERPMKKVGILNSEVPTDFFKIVICKERGEDTFEDKFHLMAFMFPNSESQREDGDLYVKYLSRYLVPVQLIEDAIGFRFFPKGLKPFTTISPGCKIDFDKCIKDSLPRRVGQTAVDCEEPQGDEGPGCTAK